MLRIACRLWSNIRSMVVVLLYVCPTSPIKPRWNGYTPSRPDCRRHRRPASAKRHTPRPPSKSQLLATSRPPAGVVRSQFSLKSARVGGKGGGRRTAHLRHGDKRQLAGATSGGADAVHVTLAAREPFDGGVMDARAEV